ncbi:MAG: phage Gp37/Gp68 family protein [Planctomycetes bacterium]|nr:phage Gp37/Gp68 family protein [Planctomycetota bacterium]
MSDASNIQWTDATWNPVTGCSAVSPGCANCYAAHYAARFHKTNTDDAGEPLAQFHGPDGARRARWSGRVKLHPDRLDQPMRWRKPRRIFVCSMADLFHEDVPTRFIDAVMTNIALCPQHTFQVLTKRPERMADYFSSCGGHPLGFAWPLPNLWLGVSCEDQQRHDERIGHLRVCPAAVRFLSCEPLLGPIDLGDLDGVGWVIAGGESGPGARACHTPWLESIVFQCDRAGVPVFIKQLGARPVTPSDVPVHGRFGCDGRYRQPGFEHYMTRLTISDRHGADQADMPAALRRREFPDTTRTQPARDPADPARGARPPIGPHEPARAEKRGNLSAHEPRSAASVAN